MERKRSFSPFLKWAIGIGTLTGLMISIYLGFFFYKAPQKALSATTSLFVTLPDGKSNHSERDTVISFHFFSRFPELEQDYLAFQAFINTSDPLSGIGVITNLRSGDLALGLILDLRQYSFHWPQKKRTSTGAAASYQGHPIYRFENMAGRSIAVAKYRNLLLLGRESLQVEAALSALKGKSRLELPGAAIDQNQLELHLLTENLSALGNGIFSNALMQLIPDLQSCISHVKLQWQYTATGININGHWYAPEPTPILPDTLNHTAILSYLPASVQWCKVNLNLAPCQNQASPARSNLEQYFKPWQAGYSALMAWPQLDPKKEDQVFIIKHRNAQIAQNSLDQLTQSLGSLENMTYLDVFDGQQMLGKSALLDFGLEWVNPWWLILEDYVVFASSKEALTHYLDDYLVGNHLQQSEDFLQLFAQQAVGKNWFYSPSMNFTYEGENWIRQEIPTYHLFFKELFTQYPKTIWSVQADHSFKGVLIQPEAGNTMQMVWRNNLSGTPLHPPQVVSWKSEEKALLIQQNNGELTLYHLNGNLAWRFPVDGPIIGAIQELSVHGQIQYAFNSSKFLYVLDNTGRQVPPFPLALPDTACNQVLSVDFDHNGRYHHFIAGKKKTLYGFTPTGDLLPAWSPLVGIDTTLSRPMKHFQYNHKDFLLALSDEGTLYAFKRDGTPRFDSIPSGQAASSPLYFQNEKTWQRIAWGDPSGLAHIVNAEGGYFRLSLAKSPTAPCQFVFENMLGDERKDYISLCGNALSLNYYEGQRFQKAWEKKLNFSADQLLLFPKGWIGLTDKQNRKIYLLDESGQIMDGFPIAGDGAFDLCILPDGSRLLLTLYEESLYAYRIMH